MALKTKIIKLKDNSQGYKYNVQIWVNNYYNGNGKFFKTKAQAIKYAKSYMKKGSSPLKDGKVM